MNTTTGEDRRPPSLLIPSLSSRLHVGSALRVRAPVSGPPARNRQARAFLSVDEIRGLIANHLDTSFIPL